MLEDIAAFLRARFDERQLVLLNVSPARVAWATFLSPDGSMRYTSAASANGEVWVCDGHIVEPDSVQLVFDRDQELADIAAKRQIVWEHGDNGMFKHDDNGDLVRASPLGDRCTSCLLTDDPLAAEAGSEFAEMAPYPCRTLRLLALPYAGHPEYREEWRP